MNQPIRKFTRPTQKIPQQPKIQQQPKFTPPIQKNPQQPKIQPISTFSKLKEFYNNREASGLTENEQKELDKQGIMTGITPFLILNAQFFLVFMTTMTLESEFCIFMFF